MSLCFIDSCVNSKKLNELLIATTCLVYDLPLWTYNKKDFRFIDELELIDGKNDKISVK